MSITLDTLTDEDLRESEEQSAAETRRINEAFDARYCGGDGWTGEE